MALPINIDSLINKNTVESERIEFKAGFKDEAIIHSICAFANDINNWGGGYIIIGFEDNNGRPLLPPMGVDIEKIDFYQRKLIELCNKIEPTYFPVIDPTVFQNKHIIVLWCPGGDNRPYSAPSTLGNKSQRQYYIRRGSNSIKANDDAKKQLFELTAKIPFDDRINHNSSISDLDIKLILEYLKEVGSKLYEESDNISIEDICRQMQIVKGSKEYFRPTNVGILFFNNNPGLFFRGAYIDIALYKDNDGIKYEQKEFFGPLHYQIRDALKFIDKNIIRQTIKKIEGRAEAERFYNYPYEAIEEALVNAVYHRSYEHPNQVEIHVRFDRIEIVSYPGAMPPVDNKALKKRQVIARVYRNRRIGDFLKELKLTEAKGTGIPTIRKFMAKNGSPTPIFQMDDDRTYFLTVLKIHRESFVIVRETDILSFCLKPRKRKEILEYKLRVTNQTKNFDKFILPLIKGHYLEYTIKDNPTSKEQKYVTTRKGQDYIKQHNFFK
ncbi:MAG: AAA family ATPase [Bacteroidetes bacterium]|nr:MAG: AAA family ATPase [Bacteroidota bacterium]